MWRQVNSVPTLRNCRTANGMLSTFNVKCTVHGLADKALTYHIETRSLLTLRWRKGPLSLALPVIIHNEISSSKLSPILASDCMHSRCSLCAIVRCNHHHNNSVNDINKGGIPSKASVHVHSAITKSSESCDHPLCFDFLWWNCFIYRQGQPPIIIITIALS